MAKRNYLKEISEIKKRSRGIRSHFEALIRLHEISETLNKLNKNDKELLKYIPISLVGCMEVFFRHLTNEIIDFGSPYIDNANKLEIGNFNFEVVRAIQGKYITIGEFISHLLSFNNINDIERNISSLLGEGFFKQLKTVKAYYPWKKHRPDSNFISDWDDFYKYLEKTFELRHIFCHEITKDSLVDYSEIEKCFNATARLIDATNYLMYQKLLRERDDFTQAELTRISIDKYQKENSKLETAKKQLLAELEEHRVEKFQLAQELWEQFKEANASFISSQFEGGSIEPQVYHMNLRKMTLIRRKELEDYLENGFL